jgi:hypothetical protein
MANPKPYSVPGTSQAVTATSTGIILKPPPGLGQGGYGWAVLTNCSPWIATVNTAAGAITLQPYTMDVVHVIGMQQVIISMSVPSGSSPVLPPAALSYVQADWYAAGSAPPDGYYPVTLTAQALQAFMMSGYDAWPGFTGPETIAVNQVGVLLTGARDGVVFSQVTVAATATLIVPAPSTGLRTACTIHVPAAGQTVAIGGNSGVLMTGGLGVGGFLIEPGHSMTVSWAGQIYGIVAATTQVVSFWDE